MILKLKYPIFLIIISTIFYSCEKEYSIERDESGSTAIFTFSGSPAACANAVVTGIYQVGTAMDATNIATLNVDVTTMGTYTITTATVNGISFSGTGTFTSTGSQVVQLSGSGIPLVEGTFDFTPGSNSCTFPVIVTGSGGGSAVFTYDGGTGPCTSAIPAGTYSAGSALTASNTVTLGVNVTTIGTWSISTPIVNGFSFSGTGSFAATGPQTVTLTGVGTPAAEGISGFTPSNNGCAFTITVLPAGAGSTDLFYEATIDVLHYKETVTGGNDYEAGSSIAGTDDVILSSNISPSTQPIPANKTEMTISKGILHNYLSVSNATFKSFFDPGTYPWASSGSDGIVLSWTDGTGTVWTTDNPPGTQTGSVFTIVSVEDEPAATDYYIRVTATFNCKIYDLNGNVKTITNGKYVGLFGKF